MSFNVGNKEVHIQRKKAADSPFLQQLLGLGLALLLVLAVTSIIIATSGKSPLAAFQCMIKGAFGTKNSVAETLIKTVPLLLAGFIGRYAFKLNYYTLIGVLAGSTTNPPALAYSNDLTSCDAPAVGYATVYPLTMFLRVLTAQLLILSLG